MFIWALSRSLTTSLRSCFFIAFLQDTRDGGEQLWMDQLSIL